MTTSGAGRGQPVLAGCRVLLVEDEYLIAAELARTFAELGAEVVGPVADVSSALAIAAGHNPLHAAVLDINLQGRPVAPVAEALVRRGVRFVYLSGYETLPEGAGLPEAPLIDKLLERSALLEALSEAFAERRPAD